MEECSRGDGATPAPRLKLQLLHHHKRDTRQHLKMSQGKCLAMCQVMNVLPRIRLTLRRRAKRPVGYVNENVATDFGELEPCGSGVVSTTLSLDV